MNGKKKLFIIVTAIVVTLAFYLGASKVTQMRRDAEMSDTDFIESKIGYQLPHHWKVVSSLVDENRYYWAIDGGIDESWIESMNGEAVYSAPAGSDESEDSTIKGWQITNGNRTSLVMRRCMKGCCSYVEVAR